MYWMDHNNIIKPQFDSIFSSLASINIPKEISELEANERFIIIVRHGPTRSTKEGLPGGHKDEQMTSDGIEEVEKVACLLKNMGVGPLLKFFHLLY